MPITVKQKPSERVQHEIRTRIEAGILAPGERLPSEVRLASEFDVGRRSVRTALRHLGDMGLIQSVNKRVRIVTPAIRAERSSPHSVMKHSVAVFSVFEGKTSVNSSPGWEEFVELGVRENLQVNGWLSLDISPEALNQQHVQALLSDPPVGLVSRDNIDDYPLGQTLLKAFVNNNIPVALYAANTATSVACDTIVTQHEQGTYDLTAWLVGQGCRRILRLWVVRHGSDMSPCWLQQRDTGYERAVSEAGLPVLPAVRIWATTKHDTEERHSLSVFETAVNMTQGCLADWFRCNEPIDAIMAISDGHVFAVAEACRRLDVDPVKDVTIVGYDNYWQDAPQRRYLSFEPAATVDKNNLEIGRELARIMDDRIRGKLGNGPVCRCVAQKLIVTHGE